MRSWDRVVGLGVSGLVFLSGSLGVARYGLTWDEPTYFRFARLQREWFGDLAAGLLHPDRLKALVSGETVARVWLQHAEKNGHPPLGETWQALASIPFHLLGFHDTIAFRLTIVLLLSIGTWLLYDLVRRCAGAVAGVVAALSLVGVPAVWAHGHLGATETMQNFFWVCLAWLLPAALGGGRGWVFAFFMGCALAFTGKFTNLLIPFCLLGTAGLLGAWRLRRYWVLVGLGCIAAPAALLLLDPWFWPWQGGIERFIDYLRQTTTRGQWMAINVYYLGKSWGFHPPWHYRPLTLLASLPLPVSILTVAGIAPALDALLRGVRRQRWDEEAARHWPGVLGVSLLLFTFVTGWLPSTPNHDGTRQFVFAFAATALLSAWAVPFLARWFEARWGGKARSIAAGAAILAGAAALGVSLAAEPWGLSYFAPWIGGTGGAWARGFEVTYWGDALGPAAMGRLARTGGAADSTCRVYTIPKLNYCKDAEDFWLPIAAPDDTPAPERVHLGEDVRPAYFESWTEGRLRTEYGGMLRLTFLEPPDVIQFFYRRATLHPSFVQALEDLAKRGDLTLVDETRLDGVPLARVYRVNRLRRVVLSFDPEKRAWYQPASLEEIMGDPR